MPQLIAWFMAAFTVLLGTGCILTREKRRQMSKRGTVQLPFGMAVIGMIGGAAMSIFAIGFSKEGILPVVIFSLFILLSQSLMLGYINCTITYDSKGFTARNIFGIQRDCLYSQVTGVREGKDCWVYFGGHRILVDECSEGGEEFRTTLRKYYTAQTAGLLPEYPRRWDPMNGHIEYPWVYFILWIVMAVSCLGLMGLPIYSLTVETDPAELTPHTLTFTEYKIDNRDKELLLYAPGCENPFRIYCYQDYRDGRITPEALCSGETYTVYTKGPKGLGIRRLVNSKGIELISIEQEREVYRNRQRPAAIFMLILGPVGFVFSVFGIALTRNPDRYPDWVRKLYYKDGYLH